jgi:hypothetical protein
MRFETVLPSQTILVCLGALSITERFMPVSVTCTSVRGLEATGWLLACPHSVGMRRARAASRCFAPLPVLHVWWQDGRKGFPDLLTCNAVVAVRRKERLVICRASKVWFV